MVKRTDAVVEAVAALLYNLMYDQDGNEGWTPDELCYDLSYRVAFLSFAQALLQVIESDPDASDHLIVQQAASLVDQEKAGFSWDFLALDETVVSFPATAESYVWAVREFLENPDGRPEGEFLQREVSRAE